jgi:hypothetical protein
MYKHKGDVIMRCTHVSSKGTTFDFNPNMLANIRILNKSGSCVVIPASDLIEFINDDVYPKHKKTTIWRLTFLHPSTHIDTEVLIENDGDIPIDDIISRQCSLGQIITMVREEK